MTEPRGHFSPLLKKYIRGGTIIHSDSAAMYVNNAQQQSPHQYSDNSYAPIPTCMGQPYPTLCDPLTRACTNHVEGFWKNVKKKNKEMCGTTAELLPSYLDEVQWRQMYGKKTVEAFNNILAQIAQFYPVNN